MLFRSIQSNYRGMGSGMVPDGLGFGLQDRGELFDLTPGRFNTYAPKKRPFHTIIPAFVTRAGRPVLAFGVAHPRATQSMLLYWPVGGVYYRLNNRQRFAEHLKFVKERGLDAVVALVTAEGKPFNQDPRGGPWATVIRRDAAFARQYARRDVAAYSAMVAEMGETLVDRDTAPGATPEELMRLDIPALVVPGRDKTHATSAARYLEECLPRSEYWDIPVAEQTEANVPARLITFLETVPRP